MEYDRLWNLQWRAQRLRRKQVCGYFSLFLISTTQYGLRRKRHSFFSGRSYGGLTAVLSIIISLEVNYHFSRSWNVRRHWKTFKLPNMSSILSWFDELMNNSGSCSWLIDASDFLMPWTYWCPGLFDLLKSDYDIIVEYPPPDLYFFWMSFTSLYEHCILSNEL